MAEFVIGDSRPYVVDLTINDAPFIIDPGYTVKAAIVSADKRTARTTEPATLSHTALGADWTKSKVVVKFPRASTSGIVLAKKSEAAYLEIQVTLGTDDWTWHIPITLIPGTIV